MNMEESDSESCSLFSVLRKILDAVEREEYQTALELLESSVTVKQEDIELKDYLQRAKNVCLLSLSKYEPVAEDLKSDYRSRAYAYYKLENYSKAMEILSQNKNTEHDSSVAKALEAQCRFYLNDSQAIDAFAELDDSIQDGFPLSNAIASLVAHRTSLFCNQELDPSIVKRVENYMDQKDDCPYELLFNWGVLQLLTTPDSAARIGLHKLIDSAALSAEKMGEYSDRSTILMNQDILRDIWRPSIATPVKSEFSLKLDEMPETTRTVRDVHREMAQENARRALLLLENEPSAKLIPLQKLLWYYNRAIYQLRTAQYDKCRGTCELLLSYAGLPNPGIQTKKDKRQARSTGLSHSPENQLWWQVRVAVLLAHCSIRNQTEDTNRDLLHSLERLEKTVQQQLPVDSSTRAHLETYLAVHRAAISRKSNNVLTVDGLPENVKKFAAVGAVKQCLCHDLGVTQTAVKPQPSKSDVALADFHYSLGDYELAASLFERVLDEKGDNMVARACWIRALSHTDPKKAIEEWQSSGLSTVNPGNEQHHSFGNEFETQDSLPWWLLQVRKGQRIEALEQNRKKSRGAVARQRNKKREAYIATLEATNGDKASKPDPERWLPKHERVRARRKHGGKIFTSSQGGISEKDAAKLDVVARQAARAAGATEGPSTAHLTVTAAANMRKGKSGKRR